MIQRYATIIVLAEDERSANLIRRYVQRALNVSARRIRQEISPSAAGDAKHWVIHRYPIEVREVRRGLSRLGLVVHLDADVESVDRRRAQLAEALRDNDQPVRARDERISLAIPKRHTETWLCRLTGTDVDESQDCKRLRLLTEPDRVIRRAADQLYLMTRANAAEAPLPSLTMAVVELRRLEQ